MIKTFINKLHCNRKCISCDGKMEYDRGISIRFDGSNSGTTLFLCKDCQMELLRKLSDAMQDDKYDVDERYEKE